MPQSKIISLLLMIIPVIIILTFYLNSINTSSKTNIGSIALKQDESFCEYGKIDIVSCETSSKTNLDSGCSEKQIKKWEGYKNYLNEKDCNKLSSESKKGEDKKLACNCLQQKIYDLIKNENGEFTTGKVSKNTQELIHKLDKIKGDSCSRTKISELSPEFLSKVKDIANKHGSTKIDLLKVMAFESGHTFCSCVVNKHSGAVGLIQFMPEIASELGTTSEKLCKMTRIEQLDYVDKYLTLKSPNKKLSSLNDLYMSILWPTAIGKPEDFEILNQKKQQYEQNKNLDTNGDKKITIAEAMVVVNKNTDYT